jgi:hypothetical protein
VWRTSTHPVRSRPQSQAVVGIFAVFRMRGAILPIQNPAYSVNADHLASLICRIPEKPTGAASIPAGSQPYHAFPAPDGSRGTPKDTSLVDFVFARPTRESVGHRRTRHRHGSGP